MELKDTRVSREYHEINATMNGLRKNTHTHDATLILARLARYPRGREDRLGVWLEMQREN